MSAEREAHWSRVLLLDQLAGCASTYHDLDSESLEPGGINAPTRYSPSAALAWTDDLDPAPIPAPTRAAAQELSQELLEALQGVGDRGA